MKVTKAIIPAAGLGTRLEPITFAIPKELLMIGNRAIIEYIIEAMKQVDVKDITVVVGWRKHAILDYLGSGERLGVKLSYVVQDKRDGLAKAVASGEHLIKDEAFLVVLGDDFFYPTTFLKDVLEFHEKMHAEATIGVAHVRDPTRHGIIKPGEDNRIIDIVEKPSRQDAFSTLGVIGIYIFQSSIFTAIHKLHPGVKGEYQLTDAIKILIDEGKTIVYKEIEGTHIDIGTLEDYRLANEYLSNLSHSK